MADSLARESSLPSTSMTLPEVYSLVADDLAEVEKRLAAIERPEVPLTSEIMEHVLALRGKRVRPLLLLLVNRLGRAEDPDGVLWASAVIELVHTASLLHDDCLDGTTIRRGVPTVNHRWDSQAAILMGDYLFTIGFDLLCKHDLYPALHILTHHTHRMTCGMNREYASRHDAELDIDEYLRIIDEKTGALFVSSCEIGAVLGGLSEEATATISEFGRDLGFAFQIIDDIFDFTGDPAAIGKPVGTDFRLGFATLPLLLAFRQGDAARSREVAGIFRRGRPTDGEWKDVREFVVASGGIEGARERALAYAYSARDRLLTLGEHEGIDPLLATVEYMIARGR
jgi:octaprenyl-diphosphate synthase